MIKYQLTLPEKSIVPFKWNRTLLLNVFYNYFEETRKKYEAKIPKKT